jgi:DNA (cytosine-5)-methyltransferase 1
MGDVNIDNHIARPITASMSKWHRANQDNYLSEKYIFGNDPYNRPKVNLKTEKIRRITPLEGFRIQGFPDKFEKIRLDLGLSYSASYRLIGNAVPVDLVSSVVEHYISSYEKIVHAYNKTYAAESLELGL